MSRPNDNYTDTLLEEIRDQNLAVLEAVGSIREELALVPKREEFEQLQADVKVIKTAVKDQSADLKRHERQLDKHEQRLRRLKAA